MVELSWLIVVSCLGVRLLMKLVSGMMVVFFLWNG